LSLTGDVTRVMVAHRLTTVGDFGAVAYLSHGHVVSIGTFEHFMAKNDDFTRQARPLGLNS